MRMLLRIVVALALVPLRAALWFFTWPLRARLLGRARMGAERAYFRVDATARRMIRDPRFQHPVF